MAIHHSEYSFFGVQFHPESFLSEEGDTIISNFINIALKVPACP
jgi:anthranilate/para-aminobenzoate synthase component II